MQIHLALVVFIFGSISFASGVECNSNHELAKYACVKAGDQAESEGKLQLAVKYWQLACKKGLNSACETLEQQKSPKAEDEETSSLELAVETMESKYRDEAAEKELRDEKFRSDCASGKTPPKACLQEAKKRGSSEHSLSILRGLCDADNVEACFTLGGVLTRSGRTQEASKTYLRSCSLGDEKSCAVLQRVQADLTLQEQKAARQEAREQQILEAQHRQAEQAEQNRQQFMNSMINASQKIGAALAGTSDSSHPNPSRVEPPRFKNGIYDCGIKPIPGPSCNIGRCVNGQWEEVCR